MVSGNGEFSETYKGCIICPGIIMPSYGIYEINVYLTREDLRQNKPSHTAGSLEEAKRWVDSQEAGLALKESKLPEASLREQIQHGSYVIFTNPETGKEKQFYNANPPDSPEVASAAASLKALLEENLDISLEVRIEAIPRKGG